MEDTNKITNILGIHLIFLGLGAFHLVFSLRISYFWQINSSRNTKVH